MRGCPALMWKASAPALAADSLEAREEPFELEQERNLRDTCECVCWFPAARGGQEGTALAALSQGSSSSWHPSCSGLCHHPHPPRRSKDARPGLLSSQGRRRRRDKCKNPPTALPARCTHAANAPALFYPGLPVAPCANTASAHARARAGSSACKTHIWEVQLTSMQLFHGKWVLLKPPSVRGLCCLQGGYF